jgi:ubiquinone/menaquinone biosynthesis C-methylase UbiE
VPQPPNDPKLNDQHRWNAIGGKRLAAMRKNPAKFVISGLPQVDGPVRAEIKTIMDGCRGKRALEIGCGRGEMSIYMALQGAKVHAIDVGRSLIEAGKVLAKINKVSCLFKQASATELPYEDDSFELVIGIFVLHHLSESDLVKAVGESHRVLKKGGMAVFFEPVENNALFDLLQDIFPRARKAGKYNRPSRLNRNKWEKWKKQQDERSLTTRELLAAGKAFSRLDVEPYGFLYRLAYNFPKLKKQLLIIDNLLLNRLKIFRSLSQLVAVKYYK